MDGRRVSLTSYRPDLGKQGESESRLERSYHIQIAGDIGLRADHGMRIQPVGMMIFRVNMLFTVEQELFLRVQIYREAFLRLPITGAIWILAGFHNKTGKIMFFYNYRFNLKSGNIYCRSH